MPRRANFAETKPSNENQKGNENSAKTKSRTNAKLIILKINRWLIPSNTFIYSVCHNFGCQLVVVLRLCELACHSLFLPPCRLKRRCIMRGFLTFAVAGIVWPMFLAMPAASVLGQEAKDSYFDETQAVTLFAFDDVSIPFTQNLKLQMHSPKRHPANPVVARGREGACDSWAVQSCRVRCADLFLIWHREFWLDCIAALAPLPEPQTLNSTVRTADPTLLSIQV